MRVWVTIRPWDGAISEVYPTRSAARRSPLHRLAHHLVRRAALVQMDRPFFKNQRFAR